MTICNFSAVLNLLDYSCCLITNNNIGLNYTMYGYALEINDKKLTQKTRRQHRRLNKSDGMMQVHPSVLNITESQQPSGSLAEARTSVQGIGARPMISHVATVDSMTSEGILPSYPTGFASRGYITPQISLYYV